MTVLQLRPVSRPTTAVEISHLSAGYTAHQQILRDVSLEVPLGSCCAIVGPSGGGKTTLLRAIAGLVTPSGGTLRLPMLEGLNGQRRSAIGYIPQQLGLVRTMSVRQNVLLGVVGRLPWTRSLMGLFSRAEVTSANEALASVGLSGRGDEPVMRLSGGERRRVAIARALVQGPRLLLADEFLAEVDRVTAESIIELLGEVRRETGMTVICVEHNLEAACALADRIVVLANGRTVRELDSATAGCTQAEDLFRDIALA